MVLTFVIRIAYQLYFNVMDFDYLSSHFNVLSININTQFPFYHDAIAVHN